jgi:hypothetical protein
MLLDELLPVVVKRFLENVKLSSDVEATWYEENTYKDEQTHFNQRTAKEEGINSDTNQDRLISVEAKRHVNRHVVTNSRDFKRENCFHRQDELELSIVDYAIDEVHNQRRGAIAKTCDDRCSQVSFGDGSIEEIDSFQVWDVRWARLI